MLYREWASSVQDRKGRMITLDAVKTLLKHHNPGYASVYSFSEDAALEIKANGHSRGFDKFPVISSSLTMDIDSGDEGLRAVTEVLEGLKLAFEVWDSGGKGSHVIIPHQMIESIDLPYSHWKVVEGMGLGGIVDQSLYQHGRLISLPGRVHPKTKKRKSFVRASEGSLIDVPLVTNPKVFEPTFDAHGGIDELSAGLMRMINLVINEPSQGNRHVRAWGASLDLANAGLSYDTVLDILLRINETWINKKGEDEITLAVQQAFGKG